MPFRVGDEFFAATQQRVRSWLDTAGAGDVFEWTGEGSADEIDNMVRYWHNLARVRRDLMDAGLTLPMTTDAESFAIAVRTASLDALVLEGHMPAATAARMLAAWPTLSAPAGHDVEADLEADLEAIYDAEVGPTA